MARMPGDFLLENLIKMAAVKQPGELIDTRPLFCLGIKLGIGH